MIQTIGAKGHSAKVHSAIEDRRLLMYFCLLPLLAFRFWMLYTAKPLSDFWVYWSSGHLFLADGHPYSDAAMHATLQSQGWNSTKHLVMLCPPWTLPLTALIALLPLQAANIVWHAVNLGLDCFSALALWTYFGGDKKNEWIAILVVFTFLPMGFAEWMGQITPLILASLTAFLLLERSKYHFLAGVCLLGFVLKPQLLYLVSLAILFWIVKHRVWRMLCGAALSVGGATLFAFAWNHNSFDYFRNTIGPAMDTRCGLGGALRSTFGEQHVWLQVLPCVLGIVWLLYYWTTNQRSWDWTVHLPLLVLVSICSSPYFWFHDFILIMPCVMALAASGNYRSPFTLIAYTVVQLGVFVSGLPDIWMCALSVLWIPAFWIAREFGQRVSLA